MIEIDRRSVLAGIAATAGAGLLPAFDSRSAKAAAPPAGTQNAGWYRYKVGTHEVTVVTDGVTRSKFPDGFVAGKSRDEINKGLADAYLSPGPDMIAITYTPIVVNTGSKLVVIDTGTGEANFERSKGAAGQFQNNLKASGIDRNQVDTVIISHFHGDHINGLLTPDNKPAYPNAEILVPAAEWKYFMDDAEMGKQTTRSHEGRVRRHAPRVRRARPQGRLSTSRTRKWHRASSRWRPTATRPAIARSSSPPATTRCSSSRTSPTSRCSCAIPAGT